MKSAAFLAGSGGPGRLLCSTLCVPLCATYRIWTCTMATRTSISSLARSLSSKSWVSRSLTAQTLLRHQPRRISPSARNFSISIKKLEKKFTKDHEWIELSSDGSTGTIGISAYAAHALGDVVYVELPDVDSECSAGDAIGAVESVKSASDIMTPVSGTIAETNSMLGEKPGMINESPEGAAWLAKIKLADAGELEDLMDAAAYKKFTEEVEDNE